MIIHYIVVIQMEIFFIQNIQILHQKIMDFDLIQILFNQILIIDHLMYLMIFLILNRFMSIKLMYQRIIIVSQL